MRKSILTIDTTMSGEVVLLDSMISYIILPKLDNVKLSQCNMNLLYDFVRIYDKYKSTKVVVLQLNGNSISNYSQLFWEKIYLVKHFLSDCANIDENKIYFAPPFLINDNNEINKVYLMLGEIKSN